MKMKYRKDQKGLALSVLGFGCMRFPRKLGVVDMKETEREFWGFFKFGVGEEFPYRL